MEAVRLPLRTGVCSVILLALVAIILREPLSSRELLAVTFLDVGQGDATFIESPSGVQVLIDGGRDATVLQQLEHALGFFDRDIDMVVATHPDLDHIGGLISVLERYTIHTILMTENESDTPVSQLFQERVHQEGAQIFYARRGQVFHIGAGPQGSTTLTVLFPDRDPTHLESNTASIVTQLQYGETEYLFTGDAPSSIETYLVSLSSSTLMSDVLKVGHHGSRTSTAQSFLASVAPQYAIISAGKDNSYGHPHPEVVELLEDFGVTIRSTLGEGSIATYSDGIRIAVQ